MNKSRKTLLVVGATGSIGRYVVDGALQKGYRVRALVRHPERAGLPASVSTIVGDLTRPETLANAVQDVDAVIFTHGTHGSIIQAEQGIMAECSISSVCCLAVWCNWSL